MAHFRSRRRRKKPTMDSAVIHARSSWGRLSDHQRTVALKFCSERALDTFIDALWQDSDLEGIPRAYVSADTVIVPEEALVLIRNKGFDFVEQRVVSKRNLSSEKIARLRSGQGSF